MRIEYLLHLRGHLAALLIRGFQAVGESGQDGVGAGGVRDAGGLLVQCGPDVGDQSFAVPVAMAVTLRMPVGPPQRDRISGVVRSNQVLREIARGDEFPVSSGSVLADRHTEERKRPWAS
ncbi:hypothetical protein GCM10023214_71710 [Amycolatopsis dongchuanensis]|uniref:Secreted protein n=1 Tax=Amycolatopsis dongchuanensis TaxID=1070866 RepID=A0ABP8VM27_9PSEU